MTNYIVRVELHRADEDDYARLHSLMESAGFVRWIEGRDGDLKRLPTAEYNMVLARAKTAANSVRPRPEPWILVTESTALQWSGLPPWND
jgi:hypothetical protein